ncbi:MAG: poly(R)-hydroxyalkanoic acid synthase subunit PhaE, partial [Haloferacaceae archaeon]
MPGQFDDDGMEQFLERMTETYTSAIEEGLAAQGDLVEAWLDSVEAATDDERLRDGAEGSLAVYEAWMDAAETSAERLGDAVEGEEAVDPEEFRDVWLQAANEAFKETMSTTAFAAATGRSLDEALDLRRQLDEASQETLHALGFATVGDVREVGERLVETERRLHAVEEKL